MLRITHTIAIGEDEVHERFVRASGPGGQNVNKVATAVQLRFDVVNSPSLPEAVRRRLIRLAGRRVTGGGVLIIEAKRYRTRERNRRDALDRLIAWVRKAAATPKPRRKTKPTLASKARRLKAKQQRGQAKQSRRSVRDDED